MVSHGRSQPFNRKECIYGKQSCHHRKPIQRPKGLQRHRHLPPLEWRPRQRGGFFSLLQTPWVSSARSRLCQVIANFFGGALSIGIDRCCSLDCDNYDNGVYIIQGWDIVGRRYFEGEEQRNYNLEEMVYEIDLAQPEKDRLYRDEPSA